MNIFVSRSMWMNFINYIIALVFLQHIMEIHPKRADDPPSTTLPPSDCDNERRKPRLRQSVKFPADLEKKIAAFHRVISEDSSILILTHDYPDPDCIASAFGISHLLSFWGKSNSVISFGGFVGRAENRAMIRFLNVSTVPYVLLEIKDYDCIICVDCFPGHNNVSLPASIKVNAVFDHHRIDLLDHYDFLCDIRSDLGATSTLVTEYLVKTHCPIPPKLATGLFYGIMTDTGDMGRDASAEDLECSKILFELMDHRLLAQIEHPGRDVEFFKMLNRAAKSMLLFDSVGYIDLGQVHSPDYIGEMADIFHGLEKIEFTLCTGIFKKNIFFSIRCKTRDDAGALAETIAASLNGGGGGHGKAGAGRIPLRAKSERETMAAFVSFSKNALNISQAQSVSLL
jgi:nanoRNase/pAp phosphatase (c-di-AMP/oligoRNAs hydrolase)